MGTILETDHTSGTYTVEVGGRVKYMVEESDLGHTHAGAYLTGDDVTVRLGPREREARVAGYDDDDGTYSVRCDDGKLIGGVKRTNIRRPSAEME